MPNMETVIKTHKKNYKKKTKTNHETEERNKHVL